MMNEDSIIIKKLERMYDFFCEHLQKNYYATRKINIAISSESSIGITTGHPNYLTFNIEIQGKTEREIFDTFLHEYLHAVLAPIGMHFRGLLEQIEDIKYLKYIIEDSRAKEEGILFALVDSLSDLLYPVFTRKNR